MLRALPTGATQTVDPSITGFPGPQFGIADAAHSELARLSDGDFVVVHQDE